MCVCDCCLFFYSNFALIFRGDKRMLCTMKNNSLYGNWMKTMLFTILNYTCNKASLANPGISRQNTNVRRNKYVYGFYTNEIVLMTAQNILYFVKLVRLCVSHDFNFIRVCLRNSRLLLISYQTTLFKNRQVKWMSK